MISRACGNPVGITGVKILYIHKFLLCMIKVIFPNLKSVIFASKY